MNDLSLATMRFICQGKKIQLKVLPFNHSVCIMVFHYLQIVWNRSIYHDMKKNMEKNQFVRCRLWCPWKLSKLKSSNSSLVWCVHFRINTFESEIYPSLPLQIDKIGNIKHIKTKMTKNKHAKKIPKIK